MNLRSLLMLLAVVLVVGLCGCSGGGNSIATQSKGMVKLAIVWPELPAGDDRFIPRATQSLAITIEDGAGVALTQSVPRPADGVNSVVTFPDVPTGQYLITVMAYPTTNGTGTALATAEALAMVANREATLVTLDLASTIATVTIDQYPQHLHATESAQLLATARDADGDLVAVLPQPSGFLWSSSDPAVATVDQSGRLTALTAGTVTIAAMERETGVTGTVTLMINPASGTLEIIILNDGINVIVSPATVDMMTGASRAFTAQVVGVPNQAVLWSVQEANGGTITRDGVYTAPDVPGTYHVVAASVADETKIDVVTVTVRQTRIIYCGYNATEDNYDIYSITADGANQQRLTTHASIDAFPALSSDGTRVAFASMRSGKYAIYTMKADGTEVTRLTATTYHSYQPAWSPDGSKIVFFSERDNSHDLYLMDADGANLVRLTHTPDFESSPTFSADGSKILFTSDRDGNSEIYIMNLDGSGVVNLSTNSADDLEPSCSPDGRHIVFVSNRGGQPDIYVMQMDGSNVIQLTNDVHSDTEPSFSPDGLSITFCSTRLGNTDEELFLMNSDGSGIRQITDFPNGFSIQPSWWL